MDVPSQRLETLHDGEMAVARRIALATVVGRPISPWAVLIPFKFIFDAIGREREIRWSRGHYLPPRAEALHAAAARLADDAAEAEPPAADDAYAALVERLVQHYTPMLRAEGNKYEELVKAAYPRPAELEVEWRDLAELEARIEEETLGGAPEDDPRREKFAAYREAAEDQRRRLVKEIYYA